jgi:atypical dual specificity phosphatase
MLMPLPVAKSDDASLEIPASLELRNFGISFGSAANANRVLSDIHLQLPPHGIDVLMGPVKSGKSTLCRTLAGIYEGHALHHTWGQVLLFGRPITTTHRPALVQQHARLLDAPIWQVLRQPSQGQVERSLADWRVWAVQHLEDYGLSQKGTNLLDTRLLDVAPALQRSIMALAQVLSGAPLLFLDEPTYGLHDTQAQELLAWLKKLGKRHKLCVALHNQQQARYLADSIILIGGGRLLAHQSCHDFFIKPANEWVQQFIRTGSLSLPSLNAKPEEVEEPRAHIPILKPVPVVSAQVSRPSVPPVPTATQTLVNTPSRTTPAAQPVIVTASIQPTSAVKANSSPARQPVSLPLPSKQGVELAGSVGKVMLSDSRGPQGFRWVVPGVLAGCPQPGMVAPVAYDLMLLERAGITHLITLTEQDLDQEALCHAELRNTHLPIFDRKAPSTSQMHMLLVRMQRLIDAGEALAVHCKAGLGRTGLVLAAWMIRDGGLNAETALERLRKIHPGYVQSDEQLDFLHAYEADILRRLSS